MIGVATSLGVPAVFDTLLIVGMIACAAPILVGLEKRFRIPSVVVEMLLGALLGPGALGIVHPDEPTRVLAFLGLGFLLFVAGLEVETDAIARCLKTVSFSYFLSLLIAVAVAYSVSTVEPVTKPLLVAFALASTSLGVVVAVLDDKVRDPHFDQLAIANASMGEFGALTLTAVFFSTSGGTTSGRALTLALFGLAVLAGVLMIVGVLRNVDLSSKLARFQKRTWQLDLRFAILILLAFAALADSLGIDAILGTFAAGVLIRLTEGRELKRDDAFRAKIDAVGFGLLIPVFFIYSGLNLDFRLLFSHPDHIALIPVFFLGILACRALPARVLWRHLGTARAWALGLLSSTTLTVVVVAVDAASSLHILDAPAGTALVCAALLTEIVCPILALELLSDAYRAPGIDFRS